MAESFFAKHINNWSSEPILIDGLKKKEFLCTIFIR